MSAIKTIGIMTGNSLDAVDAVLTAFENDKIRDIASHSLKYPPELTRDMLELRQRIAGTGGEMDAFETDAFFNQTLESYTALIAETVNALCAKNGTDKKEIAAIGLHGQTCDHFPPSIAGTRPPYTLQIADAQKLADLTGIPVIYDFRSDDLMNGGEAAPLAPAHNMHIARDLKSKGLFPVAFCNAGNTGNIAVISQNESGQTTVKGWDVGPFNHFADALVRTGKNEPCDKDGKYGSQGKIIPELLETLFETAAVTNEGKNFYLLAPPRSSDPSWYRLPELKDYSFEDALRTIEYLSAYTFFHTLSFVSPDIEMPCTFLIFGGGWRNPVAFSDFRDLLSGKAPVVLKQHEETFRKIARRFKKVPQAEWSDAYGYSGEYMEARIFADMAHCRITGEPFSFPESTGCRTPTVAGIYRYPSTPGPFLLEKLFQHYGTAEIIDNRWDKKWNRAVKGWQKN